MTTTNIFTNCRQAENLSIAGPDNKPPAMRRNRIGCVAAACMVAVCLNGPRQAVAAPKESEVDRAVTRGLDWLATHQTRLGHWAAPNGYCPTAMTALAGTAMLAEGSTTTQGKYAANIRKTVDYLLGRAQKTGLIGDPNRDDRYTYGHGFSMLFLSQVLGEEEDLDRRKDLVETLGHAVTFCGRAQTSSGGWGYVSAKDGSDFDEGSTTITQVQGLRGCRNAGIPVPKDTIDKAVHYIRSGTGSDGGVRYSSKSGGGGRPPITAAAIACLFNAGDYDDKFVPSMMKYCAQNFADVVHDNSGHWHYSHYYYSQVLYREGGKKWEDYRDKVFAKILSEQAEDGAWNQGYVGTVYTTAINLTILQLERGALPIYQR